MSSSIITILDYATQQISIYLGIPLLIIGVGGGLLNIIVFLSLKIFRKNSCAFYLITMSFVNIFILLTGLLSRITISGFNIDWTQTSGFYCKFRIYISQLCILLSLTCICLATIDQFFSTHSAIRGYRRNNVRFARFLIIIFTFISILHGIPYLIYFNIIISPKTGIAACSITSPIFEQYTVYGFLLIWSGILPISITIIFGVLSYRNIRQMAHRRLPIFRRALEKQMTIMVLVQVIFDLFTLLPYITINIILLDTTIVNNQVITLYLEFIKIITIYLYYLYFSCPFYIYILASKRFRRQLICVLSKLYFKIIPSIT